MLCERIYDEDIGVSINDRDNDGETALHVAMIDCHKDIVDMLLGSGADPRVADNNGTTVLMKALLRKRLDDPRPCITKC
jgi:ankyrin repeat protein